MYFRLLPEVYLINGKKKSLLQNIKDKKCFWIDNNLAYLIKECEENKPLPEAFEELSVLAKNGWGVLTESPIFVDKLRLNNIFNQKKFFKDTPYITSATLKLTNECNLDCKQCYNNFCPSCFKSQNSNTHIDLDVWKNILLNLKRFGCSNVFLTGGEVTLYKNLKELYDFAKNLDMAVSINTNGINKPIGFEKDTSFVIPVFDKLKFLKVIENFKKFSNIMLIFCFNPDEKQKSLIPSNWRYIKASLCAPTIKKNNLVNMDIFNFFQRRDKNKCLSGKIAIVENGDVYPCLGACTSSVDLDKTYMEYTEDDYDVLKTKKIGNILSDKWDVIIKKLLHNFWGNKVDNNKKCSLCEFRFACDSCTFNDVSKNCYYNLEEAVWKS